MSEWPVRKVLLYWLVSALVLFAMIGVMYYFDTAFEGSTDDVSVGVGVVHDLGTGFGSNVSEFVVHSAAGLIDGACTTIEKVVSSHE